MKARKILRKGPFGGLFFFQSQKISGGRFPQNIRRKNMGYNREEKLIVVKTTLPVYPEKGELNGFGSFLLIFFFALETLLIIDMDLPYLPML